MGAAVGYRPDLPKYRLKFADHEGLEVITRRVTVDGLMEFIGLTSGLDGAAQPAPEDLANVGELFGRFAGVLVSWNLEDEHGQPVPATREGVGSQDFQFMMEIITAWISEVSAAPPPLPGPASSGPTSLEAQLDLASSSRSLPSSPGPG